MIKFNNNNIYDMNYGTSDIMKMYYNNHVVFQYIDTGVIQTPCFAVYEDISLVSTNEYNVDSAYDEATSKWYFWNSQSEWEEYGIIETVDNLSTATTYTGKLVVLSTDNHEYQWSGSQWVDQGEVTQGLSDDYIITFADSRIPTILSNHGVYTDSNGNYTYGIIRQITDITGWFSGTSITSFDEFKYFTGVSSIGNREFYNCSSLASIIFPPSLRTASASTWTNGIFLNSKNGSRITFANGDDSNYELVLSGNCALQGNSAAQRTYVFPNCDNIIMADTVAGYFDSCIVYFQSPTPPTLNSADFGGSKGSRGFYVPKGYLSAYQTTWINEGYNNQANYMQEYDYEIDEDGVVVNFGGEIVYPSTYAEISDPVDYITFNSMEEALAYECPYVGMHAFIDGELYQFNSSFVWEKVNSYYIVEDVTSSLTAGEWVPIEDSNYNPDMTNYHGWRTSGMSNSYQSCVAKVTIYGYEHFTYYLRSSGSSNSYASSSYIDELNSTPSTIAYNTSSAITNTHTWRKPVGSTIDTTNYRRVTYNNLDKNTEHTFYVAFYNYSVNSSTSANTMATLIIPKHQENELWEEVACSASTNINTLEKNLFVDNNSTTSKFICRWVMGLPSGSHNVSTDYSNYNYCPLNNSFSFTSVEENSRQLNFEYSNVTGTSVTFNLVDENLDTITPSDTINVNIRMTTSCNVSKTSSFNVPNSFSLPRYGSFIFLNTNTKQYIYGYDMPSNWNTEIYVEDISNPYNLVYRKLNEEAVTISYTLYDPNDVESPSFKTDITYPYNGGSTSSTTLASFDVPYTYPYTVSNSNDKFSADSQSYTSSQSERTIVFVLYPNNRTFNSIAELQAYEYAWEGMVAFIDETKYKYENSEWVEQQHSLPDVAFTINYNAKNYDSDTKTLAKTSGQLADTDVTITGNTPTVNDGYLTISTNSRGLITGFAEYFNRNSSSPTLTIISKQKTSGNYCHLLANRTNNYNWMYRTYGNKLTLHGNSEQGSISISTVPAIVSVRVNSSSTATYNNWTDGTSSTQSGFSYGSTNGDVALFAGYTSTNTEWFSGDFYWIYMSTEYLTDEQIQQVIDYNENL